MFAAQLTLTTDHKECTTCIMYILWCASECMCICHAYLNFICINLQILNLDYDRINELTPYECSSSAINPDKIEIFLPGFFGVENYLVYNRTHINIST